MTPPLPSTKQSSQPGPSASPSELPSPAPPPLRPSTTALGLLTALPSQVLADAQHAISAAVAELANDRRRPRQTLGLPGLLTTCAAQDDTSDARLLAAALAPAVPSTPTDGWPWKEELAAGRDDSTGRLRRLPPRRTAALSDPPSSGSPPPAVAVQPKGDRGRHGFDDRPLRLRLA
jgi:hypothetical protein